MNAKEEFIKHVGTKQVSCAHIEKTSSYFDEDKKMYILQLGYTPEQLEQFLKSIDWNYDSGYGGQELYGNIWYKDGTWSSRGEYDGSEWWNYNKCPQIPETLIR